ncbi:SusC/RagA family TonB-linked outer membrane protein [Chitinophaga sp. MM2321]|uniref:SusC/RagA family TonB-linked outer membrane protein n=1 Tax=Chitinophaga sp. MM2321 TaxID=3137178 RepID=UPI0032D56EEC
MKKKLLFFLTFLIYYCAGVSAQSRTVSGTVVDANNGMPVPGVAVRETGTAKAVPTDNKGHFSISVSNDATLLFNYIGYEPQQINVSNQDNITVRLQNKDKQLNEVVITAYGNTKKEAFTGTAAVISNEKFKDLQVSTITGVLQGNASGVLAVSSTGQPGESPTIRIRGIGSYNASNDPLILLDGTPYTGDINSINPGDVETVTILKDASSTSIYGSRAANGIIQITTKKGSGKSKFEFSGLTGFSKRAVKEYKTLNASQYYELAWEALRNDAVDNPALLTQFNLPTAEAYATNQVVPRLVYNPFNVAQPVGLDGKLDAGAKLLWNDNWMDEMTHTGIRNDLNMNVSGSDAANTIRYYLSGGYIHDQGILKESDFKRYSGRVKVDATPARWLQLGINSSLAYSNQNYPYQGNGAGSSGIAFARSIAPIYPVYLRNWTNGNYVLDGTGNKIFDYGNNSAEQGVLRPAAENRLFNQGQNPAGTNSINPVTYERLTANGIAYAGLNLFDGLTFRSQYSMDYNQVDNNLFWNPFYGDGTTSGGYSFRGITLLYAQNFSNAFTYDKKLGSIHHINVVAGMEAFKQVSELTSAERSGFTYPSPTQPSYGTTSKAGGTKDIFRLQSYFGRAGYDIADKYHLSLSLRTDGSTRFAKDARWGVFYAAGASWNLDKEKFMENVDFLSQLKLKASYGTSGNQSLTGSFPYLGTYTAGANVGGASGSIINTIANPDLSWETQKQLDMGVEFGVLKDKITGSFVYFDRRSASLLFERPLPGSTGINSISDNVGGVKNYGFEIELNTVNIRRKNLEWRTSFNVTKLKNVITDVAPGTNQKLGGSWYEWYMQEYAGVDPTDGKPTWYMDDAANAGSKITTKKYSEATRYYLGSQLSDYTGGITNFVKYKNFDLTVLASFAIGGNFYNADYGGLMGGMVSLGSNSSTDLLNRWQSASNPGNGMVPKLITTVDNGNYSSTRFLYDQTYMRVRNITLGYRLPEAMLKRASLTNVRIFLDVQNGFTFFGGPKGADPEAGISAQAQNNNTSTSKIFSIGINVGL